jgi:hypothetical protein
VTRHEHAVRWVIERIDCADGAYRRDVELTTRELCGEASRSQRSVELLNLAAFVLRSRSRASTGDRPDAVWRQGLEIGALLLLASLATQSTAAGASAAGKLGLAAILGASVVCALLGRRFAAVGCASAAAILECVWVGHGLPAGAFASCCAVAIGGLLAAGPESPQPRAGMALAVGAAMLSSLLAAIVVGAASAEAATVVAFAWILPILLLIAGWFDPRLAAAATTIVFARLAASGFGELGRALAVLREEGQRELLVRWLAMSSGVVGAWLVTHRSIRHVARL